jgi:hypothetical protein
VVPKKLKKELGSIKKRINLQDNGSHYIIQTIFNKKGRRGLVCLIELGNSRMHIFTLNKLKKLITLKIFCVIKVFFLGEDLLVSDHNGFQRVNLKKKTQ